MTRERSHVAQGGEPAAAAARKHAVAPISGSPGSPVELQALADTSAPVQRVLALQRILAAPRQMPVSPPMQFGGRYDVPKKNGEGMERKSITSMSVRSSPIS